MNSTCSNLLDMRNLQEQVKKAFCHQKLFWPFTVWINCSRNLKNFANSRPSVSNSKSFSWSLEQFFLTVGQKNFGNKIPFLTWIFLFKSESNSNCPPPPDQPSARHLSTLAEIFFDLSLWSSWIKSYDTDGPLQC